MPSINREKHVDQIIFFTTQIANTLFLEMIETPQSCIYMLELCLTNSDTQQFIYSLIHLFNKDLLSFPWATLCVRLG